MSSCGLNEPYSLMDLNMWTLVGGGIWKVEGPLEVKVCCHCGQTLGVDSLTFFLFSVSAYSVQMKYDVSAS